MIETTPKYTYCDLNIVPAVISNIGSRSQCNPYYKDGNLPIFTAPMSSVCDDKTYKYFQKNHIIPIIHRNVPFETRYQLTLNGFWCAWTLDEFEKVFYKNDTTDGFNYNIFDECTDDIKQLNALIDVANGHMQRILDVVKKVRGVEREHKMKPKLFIMAGNVANPETIISYMKAGIDYCRLDIGGGSRCLTTPCTGVHYPLASLVQDTWKVRDEYCKKWLGESFIYLKEHAASFNVQERWSENYKELGEDFRLTQIIADGGIKSFADVNVALALGADYVMIGGLFSECIESAGTLLCKSRKGNENEALTVSAYNDENDGKYHFICDTILSQAYYNALVTKYHLDMIKRSDTHYNQFMEKRYEITLTRDQIAIPEVGEWLINTFDLYKLSFGMSSVEAQKERAEMLGKSESELILKPTEGKSETVKLKTTLKQWTDLCAWYLRDAMSYCNCWNLRDFCSGKVKLVINSQGVKNTINHF